MTTIDIAAQTARFPSVSELRPVTRAELNVYQGGVGGQQLLDLLRATQISCHVDAGDNYWFRIEGEHISDHDRWLYLLTPEDRLTGHKTNRANKTGWDVVQPKVFDGCEGKFYSANGSLLFTLGLKHTLANEVKALLTQPPSREYLLRFVSLSDRTFGSLYPSQIHSMANLAWDAEQHDMLWHYDAWSQRHGVDDLPKDTVLRMYGLGVYADALAESYDWLAD